MVPRLAVIIKEIAFNQATKSEYVCRARAEPTHTGKLGALRDDMPAGPLDRTGTDEIAFPAEGAVGHPGCIFIKVRELIQNRPPGNGSECGRSAGNFLKDAW